MGGWECGIEDAAEIVEIVHDDPPAWAEATIDVDRIPETVRKNVQLARERLRRELVAQEAE
jgi:hypothetical protein